MSDTLLAALISSAVTLIVGVLTVYFPMRQQRIRAQHDAAQARREAEVAQSEAETARRNEAAAYLWIVAETVSGMAEEFAQGFTPYNLGHRLDGLLAGYEDYLEPYLDEETQHDLRKLEKLRLLGVAEIDRANRRGIDPGQGKLSQVIADMRRITGDLEARALRISPTGSWIEQYDQ